MKDKGVKKLDAKTMRGVIGGALGGSTIVIPTVVH